MAATAQHLSDIDDPLWHFLQRVPADEALLRACEARLIAALAPDEPVLDLRDEFGRNAPIPTAPASAQTIILPLTNTQSPNVTDLLSAARPQLAQDGQLILFVRGDTDSTNDYAQELAEQQFAVVRWQPYFDAEKQAAATGLRSGWPDLWHTVTGHYVPLPWRRVLGPTEAYLRPLYEQADGDDCQHLLFVLRLSAETQPLPAANPLTLPTNNTSPAVGASGDTPVASVPPPLRKPRTIQPLLLALITLGVIAAQQLVRSSPERPLAGLLPLLLALAAGISLWRNQTHPLTATHIASSLTQARLVRAGILAIALLFSLLASAQTRAAAIALPLWLLAIVLALYALYIPTAASENRPSPPSIWGGQAQRIGLGLLLVAALAVRGYRLTAHPWMLNGIETQLGLEALRVQTLFAVNWLTNPNLPLFLTKGMIGIFGRTALALRILSPLVGTITVFALYAIGSRLWNRRTGTLAAILLAFSHTHIHFSRLGMSNVWDPLLTLLALGGCALAWRSGRRSHWLLAGLAIGFSAYFYTALHLLPLMLLVLLVVVAAFNWQPLQQRAGHVAAAGLLALTVALPQMRFFWQNPQLFMERAYILNIFETNWLAEQGAVGNGNGIVVFGRILWQSIFSFNGLIDLDSSYNAGQPLVSWLTGTLLLLGLGITLTRLRQPRHAALFATFVITIFFAGALLVDLPTSRRLLIAFPAVMLLAATAADWLLSQLSRTLPQATKPRLMQVSLALVLLFGLLDVAFYFGSYQDGRTFGDRNTEIGHATATYLNALEGDDWTIYFHGPPQIYAGFSTIPFLASQFQLGENLHDYVVDTSVPPAQTANVAHIFTPDHYDNIALIQAQFPNGTFEQIDGFHADPIIVTFTATR